MCLHHPYFLIFPSFKCNIVIVNVKFKFTYSKGWQKIFDFIGKFFMIDSWCFNHVLEVLFFLQKLAFF